MNPFNFFSQGFDMELSVLRVACKNIPDSLPLFPSRVLFSNGQASILSPSDLEEIDCLLHGHL